MGVGSVLFRPSQPVRPLERCLFADFNPPASLRNEVAFPETDLSNMSDACVLLRQRSGVLRRSVYMDHLV
jgi:hypothetical protein